MKKILCAAVMLISAAAVQAQYASINTILDQLEARRGINQNLKNVNIDDTKFVLVKDFEDHTERSFIVLKDNLATYVEMFDDKKTGETSSNVFSGDIVRTQHNIISLRADKLEGQKIALPITKTLLMTKLKKTLYLVDVNTRERWIEESAINKN
ncbi:hypothetical protein L0B70_08645 [Kaistella sp. 97-N-M2]|uniref:hypothetical protein n=1 Tax=Kaistella sp. 97-N-M2 TaxID=2908645 RepID=UPI001F397428|nr:hypothetical protein [Kaistella sp. 97-N-M2]UJF28925.1 hypothetical protein L0B70_08645 [Kaistella sp. 97-N-M2]